MSFTLSEHIYRRLQKMRKVDPTKIKPPKGQSIYSDTGMPDAAWNFYGWIIIAVVTLLVGLALWKFILN